LQELEIMIDRFANLARVSLFGTVAILAGSLTLLVAAGPAVAIDMSTAAVASSSTLSSTQAAHAA
jgi:hypothetical protein